MCIRDRVGRDLRKMFGNTAVDGLWLPYFAATCNLTKGCTTVQDSGPLWRAVLASNSPVGLFPPVLDKGDLLMKTGHLIIARQFDSRAFQMGAAEGAMGGAKTYDPAVYTEMKVQGITPDAAKAADALRFHRDIEAAVARNQANEAYRTAGYRITPIVGIFQNTDQSARLAGGKVTMFNTLGGEDMGGDGTVPRVSATPIELSDDPRETYVSTKHGSLQNAEAVLSHVVGALTRKRLERFRDTPFDGFSLSAPTLLTPKQELDVVATTMGPPDAVRVTLVDVATGRTVRRRTARRRADGSFRATIPPLAEVQLALEQAVADVTQLKGFELKKILRTGTVASTDNRNWELLPDNGPQRRFSQSRAVALDMESATIAANGFRFRVPYGTLLCVSDKPLHGEIKLPGMANHFYRERVDQHLRIGIRAVELLRTEGVDQLHSRKLRSFAEVAFQ